MFSNLKSLLRAAPLRGTYLDGSFEGHMPGGLPGTATGRFNPEAEIPVPSSPDGMPDAQAQERPETVALQANSKRKRSPSASRSEGVELCRREEANDSRHFDKIRLISSAASETLEAELERTRSELELLRRQRDESQLRQLQENKRLREDKESLNRKVAQFLNAVVIDEQGGDNESDDGASTDTSVCLDELSQKVDRALQIYEGNASRNIELETRLEQALLTDHAERYKEQRQALIEQHAVALEDLSLQIEGLKKELAKQVERQQHAEKSTLDSSAEMARMETVHEETILQLQDDLKGALHREAIAVTEAVRVAQEKDKEISIKGDIILDLERRVLASQQIDREASLRQEEEISRLRSQCETLQQMISNSHSSATELTALRAQDGERHSAEMVALRESHAKMITRKDTEMRSLTAQLEQLSSVNTSSAVDIAALNETTTTLTAEVHRLKESIVDLEVQKNSLEEALARAADTAEERSCILSRTEDEVARYREQLGTLEASLASSEAERATSSSRVDALTEQLSTEQQSARTQIEGLMRERDGLKQTNNVLQQQVSTLTVRTDESASLEARCATLQEMVDARDRAMAEDARFYEALKEELQTKTDQLNSISKRQSPSEDMEVDILYPTKISDKAAGKRPERSYVGSTRRTPDQDVNFDMSGSSRRASYEHRPSANARKSMHPNDIGDIYMSDSSSFATQRRSTDSDEVPSRYWSDGQPSRSNIAIPTPARDHRTSRVLQDMTREVGLRQPRMHPQQIFTPLPNKDHSALEGKNIRLDKVSAFRSRQASPSHTPREYRFNSAHRDPTSGPSFSRNEDTLEGTQIDRYVATRTSIGNQELDDIQEEEFSGRSSLPVSPRIDESERRSREKSLNPPPNMARREPTPGPSRSARDETPFHEPSEHVAGNAFTAWGGSAGINLDEESSGYIPLPAPPHTDENGQVLSKNRFNPSVIPPILPPGMASRRQPTPGPSRDRREITPSPGLDNYRAASTPSLAEDISDLEKGFSPHVARTVLQMAKKLEVIEANLTHGGAITPSRVRHRSLPKVTPSPFKLQPSRRPRSQAHVEMMRDIRKVMNRMLGITKDRDIVDALRNGHFVTEEQATAIMVEGSLGSYELLEDNLAFMRPCWDKLKNEYNVLLGNLFTERFVVLYPEYEGGEDEVVDHFHQRLTTLKSEYSKQLPRRSETQEDAIRRAEYTRVETLRTKRVRRRKTEGFEKRVSDVEEFADCDPAFQPVLQIVEQLGVEGYSSDETCDEGYIVKKIPWRSMELDPVLQVARSCRPDKNAYGNRPPGAPARARLYRAYGPVSTGAAPQGLPINFYDKTWYEGLHYATRSLLNPLPAVNIPVCR